MKRTQMWLADDGRVFESQDECAEYEADLLAAVRADDYSHTVVTSLSPKLVVDMIVEWERYRRKLDAKPRSAATPSVPLTENEVLAAKRAKLVNDVNWVGGSMANEELEAFDKAFPHIANGSTEG